MRQAAIYSAALHLVVITITYFGAPALFSTPTVEDNPITVDLVSLQDVTKPPPEPEPPKPEPPPEAKPSPPPPPPPATTPEPPPPPPPVAERPPEPPPPEAKPEPPPPPPEPKPKPVAKPRPKPEPPPQPAEVKPAPEPKVAAAPPPKRKPVREDQFQALLKNLAKQKEEHQRRQKPVAEAKPAPAPTPAPQRVARASVDRQLSERRLTALVKQQLAPCWSIPAGAKDAQNMRVAIQIRLNTDGTLRGMPHVVDDARVRTDRVYRAVAESAVRALLNPRCSPLKLPYEEYEIWQNITFNFDPGEALGP